MQARDEKKEASSFDALLRNRDKRASEGNKGSVAFAPAWRPLDLSYLCCKNLGYLGDASVLPALFQSLEDPYPLVPRYTLSSRLTQYVQEEHDYPENFTTLLDAMISFVIEYRPPHIYKEDAMVFLSILERWAQRHPNAHYDKILGTLREFTQ